MHYVDDALRGKLVLPTIPRVVRRAMSILREPSSSTHELVAELAQDPVMSARVLRMANSPYYAGRRTLASIDDAVGAVGTQALGTLLIASGLSSAFVEVSGVHLRDFWMHSGVTAMAARTLARQCNADPEAAYLAGLLHEAGHLILCQAFPEHARRWFANEPARHGQALADLELQAFGTTHPQVSAHWCASMQLPDGVTEAVALYLRPERAETGSWAPLLLVASTLAADIGSDVSAAAALARVDRNLLALGNVDLEQFESGFDDRYAALRDSGAQF
jgi:HD-like signal output (HDOD) protein